MDLGRLRVEGLMRGGTKRNNSRVELLIALIGMIPLNEVGRIGGGFVPREKRLHCKNNGL